MVKLVFVLLFISVADAKYPDWLQYSVKVIAEFDTTNQSIQQYNEGYGLIINDSLVLTSASIVYDSKKAKEITLYYTETLGEPVACLSHARVLAVDDNLDLAVLEAERFTDFYCNILPEPNFRELSFKENNFDILFPPLDFSLDEGLEISYFSEHDWSQFLREKIMLKDLLTLPQESKKSLRGIPLFVETEFLGLKVKEIKDSSSESLRVGILTHREILDFLCQLERETSIFKERKDINGFCNIPLDLQILP